MLPEFIEAAAGGQGDVHQVDGDNALVEAAVILGLAVLVDIRRQEAAAAHAGVAVALSVFVHLELQHFLLRDIIRDHPLGGTLGGQLGQVEVGGVLGDIVLLQHINQLGERRGDPDALLILDALIALAERLFNDDGQVLLFLRDSLASPRYIKTVINGAWPLVVISVTTWY